MGDNKINNGFAFKLFKGMLKDNLNYIYRGMFTQNITDSILTLTESNLEKVGESSKIKKRVFTIMVEGLQNITRHQEVSDQETITDEVGLFLMQEKNDRYYITTGNPIDKKNISKLTEQITKINSLEPEDLKLYYKQVLNDNIISDKGGAGLGLIEMARKSGNKLVYDFVDLSENYSYFYLNTQISQGRSSIPPSIIDSKVGQDIDSLKTIKEIHKILNLENIVLIFNGVFNQESLLNLLSIIENQMGDRILLKKRVFNIMVEMLQNIVKHGAVNDSIGESLGIFFINETKNKYHLNTGNYIHKNEKDALVSRINYVNSLSQDDLNSFYEKSLFNFQIDSSKEAGLGLIELRLKTGNPLKYEISDHNNDLSFFVLQTIVEQ